MSRWAADFHRAIIVSAPAPEAQLQLSSIIFAHFCSQENEQNRLSAGAFFLYFFFRDMVKLQQVEDS